MASKDRPIDETPGPANDFGRAGDGNPLDEIKRNIRRILHFIEGDGTEDQPGFKIRLDRLERAMVARLPERITSLEFQAKILWACLTAAIVALVGLGWDRLTGKVQGHAEATPETHTSAMTQR